MFVHGYITSYGLAIYHRKRYLCIWDSSNIYINFISISGFPFSLPLSTLGKFFSRWHFEIFFLILIFLVTQKTGFYIVETICMKFQILFSGKNKKNIINFSSAELVKRMVKVKIGVSENRWQRQTSNCNQI